MHPSLLQAHTIHGSTPFTHSKLTLLHQERRVTHLVMRSVSCWEMRGLLDSTSGELRIFSYTTKGAEPLKGSSPKIHK